MLERKNKQKSSGPTLSRSEIMARVRSKDTTPEIFVRSSLHKAGLRFRIHRKDLPGNPDIIFPSRRIAIFVNGCFWHQHHGCRKAKLPASRREYWETKLGKNVVRDKLNYVALESAGWRVILLWECELTRDFMARLIAELKTGECVSPDSEQKEE
ncbi:very short patch repair endonuclease [Citrifermentans bremense]|uniref:very short patch repair endonuclease n=1 Tax=Citrifermentans bremense TaxID=60035 RepID=UPI00299D9411|nr:very short patch repair endonuclease [Citrifermentans bremense]